MSKLYEKNMFQNIYNTLNMTRHGKKTQHDTEKNTNLTRIHELSGLPLGIFP